jgi:regulator of protease activity HflC (stomatin/prohibitin superfamily)
MTDSSRVTGESERTGRLPYLATVMICVVGGCATVPSGHAGVLLRASGMADQPLGEGVQVVGPWASVEIYDLRAQERSEDLQALSADGAMLEAHASVLTYHPMPEQLVALAREVGPDYYEMLVRPVVRSTVRLVLAGLRADQLDTPGIIRAEREITRRTAERLGPHHIIFDAISLRTLGILSSSAAYGAVVETGVEEQNVLLQRRKEEMARKRADEGREAARGVAAAYALLVPTLSPEVLAEAANRAWTRLVTAPNSDVVVPPEKAPYLLEVRP